MRGFEGAGNSADPSGSIKICMEWALVSRIQILNAKCLFGLISADFRVQQKPPLEVQVRLRQGGVLDYSSQRRSATSVVNAN
jgi:hypothetical protein